MRSPIVRPRPPSTSPSPPNRAGSRWPSAIMVLAFPPPSTVRFLNPSIASRLGRRPHSGAPASVWRSAKALLRLRVGRLESTRPIGGAPGSGFACRRAPPRSATMDDSAITIAVIDDEFAMRRLLQTSLEGRGYRVVTAASGTEGLHVIATTLPTLILLDLGLPDLDGLQVITQLRAWTTIPIVILSARHEELQKVAAL